jgi:hypothetical protein
MTKNRNSLYCFDNAVECDLNIYLHECPYMFRSKYDHPQKAQHVEETTTT